MTDHKSQLLHLEYKLFKFFCRLDNIFSQNKSQKILLNLLVSGGKDSMSLMHAVHTVLSAKIVRTKLKSRFVLIVTHFNHKKRGKESDEDALFVAEECLKLGIECFNFDILNVKDNFQNFARRERQRLSKDLSQSLSMACDYNSFFILTAHHLLDHVESVLLHLIRGSGLTGLQGFAQETTVPMNTLKSRSLIKPFAEISSDEILNYIKQKNIRFREDSSNLTDSYSRNVIRNHVVPKLKELNGHFDKNIFRFSKILSTINHMHSSQIMPEEFIFSDSTTSNELYAYLNQHYQAPDVEEYKNSEISENMITNILHEVNLFKKSAHLTEKKIPLKKNKTLRIQKKPHTPEQIFASIC